MPLETPSVPSTNERAHSVAENTNRIHDPYESRAFFRHAERQIAAQPEYEKWDLDEAPQAFDPDTALSGAEGYTQVPEYAESPKTRAQELEESYFYLDDTQLLHQALAISSAMPTMRRLV